MELYDNVVLIQSKANESIEKAFEALSCYNFWKFAYHAGAWIKYNRLLPLNKRKSNPFLDVVKVARDKIEPPEM